MDDARMGEAYESLSPQSRAVLKTCIARMHRIWGESPERAVSLRCPSRNFCLEREDSPADVAVIVCTADYRHPAAYLAALMPAVLAGTRTVLPFFVPLDEQSRVCEAAPGAGRKPLSSLERSVLPAAPLLAALELAGVERAYVLDEEAVLRCLRDLRPETSRLLLLGEKPFGGSLALHAHTSGLEFRSIVRPPRYWNERLQRDMTLMFATDAGCSGPEQDGPNNGDASAGRPISLDAEHENLWMWPDLEPDWFRLRRVRVFTP